MARHRGGHDFLSGKTLEALRGRGNCSGRTNGLLHLHPCNPTWGRFRSRLQGPRFDRAVFSGFFPGSCWAGREAHIRSKSSAILKGSAVPSRAHPSKAMVDTRIYAYLESLDRISEFGYFSRSVISEQEIVMKR